MSFANYHKNVLGVFCSIVLLFSVVSIGGALVAPSVAPALQGITGIDALMGAACNANYSRVAPHVCARTARGSDTLTAADTICHALDLNVAYGVSTASQWAIIDAFSGTSGALRFYSDNACTNLFVQATPVGAVGTYGSPPARLINGILYYASPLGGGGTSRINVLAYYD